jgi:hypothetical protein
MWTKLKVSLLLMIAAPVFGQTFAEINGLISDPSGAGIVGATVTVVNPQTNLTRSAVTANTGSYNFPDLPPGIYNLKVDMTGFTTEIRNGVELQVQQTARIDFRLTVGSVTETVEVSGGAPLLNTENATVGTVVENKRIEDLPLNGRSFVSLINLSPNVVSGQTSNTGLAAARSGSERAEVSLSVAGMRRTFTYYTIDGVSNTDVDYNTYAFLPSLDALQEFKVQTGVYSAEFGREVAQVNISTKSGTNDYHGTVFDFIRNNDLDARPFAFTSRVPSSAPLKWNQYGFVLGGPVQIPKLFNGKNRLFFMSNYEGFKEREQTQQVYSTPPAPMRAGNFSQLLPGKVITNPLANNSPFPGNIIPASQLNPIALGLLNFYPAPNIAGAALTNNYLALDNNVTNKDQFTQRIDFVESQASSWSGRYSWQNDNEATPALFENGVSVSDLVHQALISNTRILSPSLVNQFSFGYLGFANVLAKPLAFKEDVVQELGIPLNFNPPPIGWGIPQVNIAGFSSFGDNNAGGPWASNDHTFQWMDGLSWTHGAHSIKVGAEIRRDRFNVLGSNQVNGLFTIQTQATGYGFSDYMLGYPALTSAAAALPNAQLRMTSQGYYITDSWKVRQNLTIEAGLRYEYTPPYTSRSDSSVNAIVPYTGNPAEIINNPPPSLAPYFARDCAAYGQNSFYPPESNVRFAPGISTQCVSGAGSLVVRNDKNNFAPRLGIAWSPTPNWTVRAGAGIFFAQDIGDLWFNEAKNLARGGTYNANFTTHNLTFQQPFGSATSTNACGVSAPLICISSPLFLGVDPNLRTPYVEQAELNIQRQLGKSMVLEIGYLGSFGHKLQREMFYNSAVPSATGTIVSRTPYPQYSDGQILSGLGNSNYESTSAKLTRRLTAGLTALVSYTYSKSLDNTSAVGSENAAFLPQAQNGWCVTKACGEYSLSDFDARQRFVASILYELPVGKGKKFLSHGIASSFLGGWQLNSIITKSTGFPIEVVDGLNESNSNTNVDRPNSTGLAGQAINPTTGQWFNIAAFQLQPFGSYGNAARNSVTGPGILSWDFSTLKNFSITETKYLQLRFECFNCANHPNFGDPGNVLSSNQLTSGGMAIPGTGTFGEITGLRAGIDMRELQFSLKFIF